MLHDYFKDKSNYQHFIDIAQQAGAKPEVTAELWQSFQCIPFPGHMLSYLRQACLKLSLFQIQCEKKHHNTLSRAPNRGDL